MPRASAARLIDAAPLFAALGDPARLTIVSRLCEDGPLSIVRLTEGANISRQAVTKHLVALSDAGLVRGERSGRERVWQLQPHRLDDVRRYLDQIALQWDAAIARLCALVEEEG
ncbi:ArsR/SmtB family transcription factor [Dokdonella koreensis]|uniref:Transcriptional regulator, ArsR family n=1 Tax=Dokdonella koreensis DS-123 TaxID=1300342 RepID=A0A160DXR5_9GAMM|nr:metalloregulator ArsR/SmtB family transcription factor [Dokdonella koreensis]ANB19535.1 Transcriptional regulator, ArsR family [Dokdonella koreensis DS-123]